MAGKSVVQKLGIQPGFCILTAGVPAAYPDPTIDSQIVELKASGADVLLIAATPKFAAQSIRKIFEIGWKPLTFLSNVAVWVATVMKPAGREPGSTSCPPPMSRISTIPPGRTMPASRDGGNSWSNTFPRPTCTTPIMSIPTTARWRWKPE